MLHQLPGIIIKLVKIYSRVLKNLCWSSLFCIKLEYLVVIRKKSINIVWGALRESNSIITNHIITVSATEHTNICSLSPELCQNLLSTPSHNWSNLLIETCQADKLISSQSSFGRTLSEKEKGWVLLFAWWEAVSQLWDLWLAENKHI